MLIKRAVIFDFGGVLMKTVDYQPRHSWDDRLSLPHGSVERLVHGSKSWRLAQLGKISLEDYLLDVAGQLHLSPYETRQLADDFYSGDQLDTQLIAFVHTLRDEGHTTGLLSNDSLALLDKLHRLQIDGLFDPLVISAQIGVMKPDALAFQKILDQLQRPANETIFIDDMPANVAGAASLGIHSLRYTTRFDLLEHRRPVLVM